MGGIGDCPDVGSVFILQSVCIQARLLEGGTSWPATSLCQFTNTNDPPSAYFALLKLCACRPARQAGVAAYQECLVWLLLTVAPAASEPSRALDVTGLGQSYMKRLLRASLTAAPLQVRRILSVLQTCELKLTCAMYGNVEPLAGSNIGP